MFIHLFSTFGFIYILLTGLIYARETESKLDVKISQSNVHSLDSPETSEQPINLVFLSACSSKAEFEWLIQSKYDGGLANCSVLYSPSSSFNSILTKQRAYAHMKTVGSFTLQGLRTDQEYSVQIKCGPVVSETVLFTVKESCSGKVIPEIKLRLATNCLTMAEFEWVIFETNDTKKGLSSCNVRYGVTKQFFNNLPQVHFYKFMQNYGTVYISGLTKDEQYSVQVSCASIKSEIVNFTTGENKCQYDTLGTTDSESTVVVFKDQSSLFSTKGSILGIVFGLLGFLIIIVTTFYVLRKVRRRQRLQRIRRYLGTSLVDPFENLQNRMTHDESGVERLMASSDMV